MNNPILRLYEDELASGAQAIQLPPLPRMIFLARGSINAGGRVVPGEDVWCGEGAIGVEPGPDGATCWRFELAATASEEGALRGASARSSCKIATSVATLPKGDLIMRGDSVAFPPGGCAYLHRHQGPGIRCLFEGEIRIDSEGHSTRYGPGEAWYEAGPDAVFAQAAMNRRTRFIRFMILPRELIGKSSIQYLDERDKSKPRLQEYRVFADEPISRRMD